MAVIISNDNLKEGVGKTTLNLLLANFLHEKLKEKGKKIILLEPDQFHDSITRIREKELELFLEMVEARYEDENGKDSFGMEQKDDAIGMFNNETFGVVSVQSDEMVSTIDMIASECDVIIIDSPAGSLALEENKVYSLIDYLFVVFNMGGSEEESTGDFIEIYNKKVRPIREEMGSDINVYGILNKFKTTGKDFMEFKQRMENGEITKKFPDIKFLKTELPYSFQLKREPTTTRLNNIVNILEPGDVIFNYCHEVYNIIYNKIS